MGSLSPLSSSDGQTESLQPRHQSEGRRNIPVLYPVLGTAVSNHGQFWVIQPTWLVQLPIFVTEPCLVFCVVTGVHSQLERKNIKISLKPMILSVNCCYSPGGVCFNSYGHITQTLFWRGCKSWNLRTGFTEEMSICLSELTITSLCFTLLKIHWFVLYRNRLDDKVHEYGSLKKIYSPAPCVYKNYHKVVMFPPDWQILLSHIIFPAESLMLLISALLTQLSDSVVGTANILCVFIFIPFLYFIFHYVVLTNS